MDGHAGNLTADEARRLLSYDPQTGAFVWKVSNGRARSGDVAGRLYGNGYRYISVHGRWYRSHRLAFLVMSGRWPHDEVDHIDRNPSNNCWANLRECTHAENCQNRGAQSNNKSGCPGVVWLPKKGKWRSRIKVRGKLHHLGLFSDREAAVAAYRASKTSLHPFSTINTKNHGGN